jgi:hypothetical protein
MATWHWKTAADVFKTLSTQFETMDLAQQASQKFDNQFMPNKPFRNLAAEFRSLAQRCKKKRVVKSNPRFVIRSVFARIKNVTRRRIHSPD